MTEIRKVMITGGHELGGVQSYAEGLAAGFASHGLEAELLPPGAVWGRVGELRDRSILKILSTSAVFAAPFARRAICTAHGIPRPGAQGWLGMSGVIASYKLANTVRHARLVAVSDFTALCLRDFFQVKIDAVIRNPVKDVYTQGAGTVEVERRYLTYAGRLIKVKNVHRVLPLLRVILDENPGLQVCIIGDGPFRPELEKLVAGDARFLFQRNSLDDAGVRDVLRRSKVFFSGNGTEGLGITFLEAMSQGCVIVMPACGGGIELALDRVGTQVLLMPLSFDAETTRAVFRQALRTACEPFPIDGYLCRNVAGRYLELGRSFE
jgi:glycosyltransferase involved in cell wall biosynthesis